MRVICPGASQKLDSMKLQLQIIDYRTATGTGTEVKIDMLNLELAAADKWKEHVHLDQYLQHYEHCINGK